MKPLVALVGRPNVGKSTLFNRITRNRTAIVDSTPGVTRDRHISEAEWLGRQFRVMDTGGYCHDRDGISQAMLEQTMTAIADADVILFLVDVRSGLTYLDLDMAKLLKKEYGDKPVYLVVNKVESQQLQFEAESFRKTGFTEPWFISARDGSGVADLLDEVAESFPEPAEGEREDTSARLAVIGRPNVGKSSFVNALLGSSRHIVSNKPGTTRDAIDSRFKRNGRDIVLIDTAGLRKRTKIDAGIEFYSSLRTERAIDRCEVALVLIDAEQGLEKQDMKIIQMAAERKKGVLLLVNKWDLIEKDSKTSKEYSDRMYGDLGNLSWIPIQFISALTKKNLYRAIDTALEIREHRSAEISTSELNRFLQEALQQAPPSSKSGKELKIKYMTQIDAPWPVFAFFCNDPKLLQNNYRRFLEKRLRQRYELTGVPVSMRFQQK
ncbi:MAG: ribosome biogenesis GTPase Der [Prosthecochloris sp.]|uniref:ribosome biogenesis GTPase Der n=1 Tax=Prosthecochloris sp. ZM_2 TaxID=2045206 RepID=UPI000DF7F0C0|nr:ribosome biogenesis GTPase Der [Prosthecochloris sp. ZM_2]MEC9487308.1 ribosome biogenesis GTPase Der [Prosthecochloris sp.]RNA65361.1 ribosome biogenesis GTPase Der [Prosthecochloris sp. ZM_2]